VAYFASNSIHIFYEEHGAGSPVVLIHGFGIDARLQWGETGLIKFLAPHFRVIALDCRGHGRSKRFYDPDAYTMRNMSGDVLNLLDYLQVDRALLVGFSLGSLFRDYDDSSGALPRGGAVGFWPRQRDFGCGAA
jgi:pimeloyl-ACP methyl ester carboxylesterase